MKSDEPLPTGKEEPAGETKPNVLWYASARQAESPQQRKTLVKWLAVANALVLPFVCIPADYARVPLAKKLWMTAATCIVYALIVYVTPRRSVSQLKAVAWSLWAIFCLLMLWLGN